MALELKSPCKVNLLLNNLGKRTDGFHELETIMLPVPVHDFLKFERGGSGIRLACSDASLPVDSKNLVHRAADAFLKLTGISDGVRIHLGKKIPMAAGLGGGSGNAATTLLGLNQIFGAPASEKQLNEIAASLGSDIPFFLQNRPALALGRGEKISALDFFRALRGCYILLVHPGFGISTPWAYQQLSRFPEALNGKAGRTAKLISLLQRDDLVAASAEFYNAFEFPALRKYPLLALFQEFLHDNGAPVSLMSGSGSATFALIQGKEPAEELSEKFKAKFGEQLWIKVVALNL
jgi:4-diphosphocytidyl-2-C-methyl-D-erythritol kinase